MNASQPTPDWTDLLAAFLETGAVDPEQVDALAVQDRVALEAAMAELGPVRAELADDTTWADPDPALEARVLAATAGLRPPVAAPGAGSTVHGIEVLADPVPIGGAPGAPADPLSLAEGRARRYRLLAIAASIIAVVAITGAVMAFARSAGSDGDVAAPTGTTRPPVLTSALVATELAPDVTGEVTFSPTDSGLRIYLDAEGLPKCEEGKMYEAWVRTDRGPVSVGTFYGGRHVTLWSGTELDEVQAFAVSIQDKGSPTPSGKRVFWADVP